MLQAGFCNIHARIYWDNEDPPGSETGKFTNWGSTLGIPEANGAYSIALNWTPLTTNSSLPAHPFRPDGDFYTYRIYYRITGSPIWSVIDRDTGSPASGNLGTITTNYYKLTNITALFSYDYYLTALDIWGNETKLANRSHGGMPGEPWDSIIITPASVTIHVKVSDSFTTWDFNPNLSSPHFPSLPSNSPLISSAIKVEVTFVNAGHPDQLSIILKDFTAAGDIVTSGVLNGLEGTDYYKIPLYRVSANTWQAFISSENPLIKNKDSCKFILEAVKSGGKTYIDYDAGNSPNNYPWTFEIINSPVNTKPWPTRVLNNVITDKNPVAYPAYYLTDDAYVTIIAYDLKGRSVAMLLDNAPRPKGQNIKENGWHGTGKTGKKLGVGLYYVHIKAVRQSDGKVLIDKFNKVVMAR